MQKRNRFAFIISISTALLPFCALAMQPFAEIPGLKLTPSLKYQNVQEGERDFGTRNESDSDTNGTELKLGVTYRPSDNLIAFAEGRYVGSSGNAGLEDENGKTSTSQSFSELRQLWFKAAHLGFYPLSVQIGRQRIAEERNLMWNDNIDAVRISYDTTLYKSFLAVAENLHSYTSSGEDFLARDEDRFRVFGESSWLVRPENWMEARFLYENDHSGHLREGTTLSSNGRDDRDNNLFWGDLRAKGRLGVDNVATSSISYRLDGLFVAGTENLTSTQAITGSDLRTVTGSHSRDVLGWGLDAQADIALKTPLDPTVTLGYAFGSGDSNSADGHDGAYRQTDMQNNTSLYGVISQYFQNYGDAYRPELSNIHILTGGIGVPLSSSADASFIYHYYLRDETGSPLGNNRARVSPNSNSRKLGQETDMIVNINLADALQSVTILPQQTYLRLTGGMFFAGDAYAPNENSDIWRTLAELRFVF